MTANSSTCGTNSLNHHQRKGQAMNKSNIGDTVFLVNCGANVRGTKNPPEYWIIKKVGRKYFTITSGHDSTGWNDKEFHIDDWREKTEFVSNWKLYRSEDEYNDRTETKKWEKRLTNIFYGFKNARITLEQYRAIGEILDISTDD